ncbi:LppX_LprAFG lipoprotein [Nocardioides alcanivorans]|uniref:LppX_LprAFG lipoprotein n=1 Tax=Nocardioides alcanivorans TaxID=2897352 RepID=UPI001F1A685C|nr:LppX_LprAFG lipoprotein [Nocardioides alcanivorans]
MVKTRNLMVAGVLALTLAVSGCFGQDDDSKGVGDGKSPEEVLQLAKETLDETTGVELELTAKDLPSGVSGIVLTNAKGTAMHPSSFQGTIVGSLSGITQDGEVIAIDGEVWAKIAIITGSQFDRINPADIGAPDPSQLIATEGGLSDLLVATEDPKEGDTVRGGSDNSQVLTEYTGTLPGDQVKVLVPKASDEGSFDVVYQIAENGELRSLSITGEFYPDTDDMTYTVTFDGYGAEKEITAP